MAAATKIGPLRVRDQLAKLLKAVPESGGKGSLHCYYRPARKQKREFDPKAAARAACAARAAGWTVAEIQGAISRCVPCRDGRKRAQSAVAAESALAQSNVTLAVADGALSAFQLVSRIVGRVARFVPVARPAALVLSRVEGTLGTVRAEIATTRAANSAALQALRLAA